MREVPKASGGDRRSENFKNNTDVTFEKQKKQVISDMGFTPMQVSRFETLAAHPEIVAQAKAEARENDTIVTRADVLEMVRKGLKSA